MRASRFRGGIAGLLIGSAGALWARAGGAPTPPPAGAAATAASGNAYVSGLLVNEARDTLRDTSLPAGAAATQAAVLLQFAVRLNPPDLYTQRMLAEAARASGNIDLQKQTLRAIISADPNDFVSQVRYIDVLAAGSQNMEERSRVYQGALDQQALNAQIRSQMALRLAAIAEERGDRAQARQFFEASVKLNDLNVDALRGLARLTAAESRSINGPILQLQALATLLAANPYQPDAWLQAARICEAGTLHDRAADFLATVTDQAVMDGAPVGGELYLEMALEQAIAGQPDAFQNASVLANLSDAPIEALLIAQYLAQFHVSGSAAGQATTQSATDKRVSEIRKRLEQMVKEGQEAKRPSALADAAGIELTLLPSVGPNVPALVDEYAAQVPPDDSTLARLRGWLALRQDKLEEAQAAFEKITSKDPMAQIGLARVYLIQDKKELAARQLQELWTSHPTGLLALQVALTARRAQIPLTETSWSTQLRQAAARLTTTLAVMHHEPRDVVLITAAYRKTSVGFGEPVILSIRMTNTTDRAVSVGRNGVIKTSVGLAGTLREADKSLGIFAVEDFQRVYRLGPHQIIEQLIPVDQGKLADLLQQSPEKNFTIGVLVVTAPRLLPGSEFSTALGGQAVTAGDFERMGYPLANAGDIARVTQEISTLSGQRRLIRLEAACAFLRELILPGSHFPDQDQSKSRLVDALKTMTSATDPLVRALLAQRFPVGADAELDRAFATLSNDADPLVRLLCGRTQEVLAHQGGPGAAAAAEALARRLSSETDPLVKEWLSSALPAAQEAATRPAPAPATTEGK